MADEPTAAPDDTAVRWGGREGALRPQAGAYTLGRREMVHGYATAIATVLVILLNVHAYAAKLFLHRRGVPVGWFSRHFQDHASLRELAQRSTDRAEQARARTFLWTLQLGVVVFFVVAAPLFLWGAINSR